MLASQASRHILLLVAAAGLVACGALGQQQATVGQPTQQQQQPAINQQVNSLGAGLQAHLSQLQTAAQRQLSQLNGLVQQQFAATNNSAANIGAQQAAGSNVLEVLSNVGKVIQQQMLGGSSVQIITSPASSNLVPSAAAAAARGPNSALGHLGFGESANNKKNEYQPIVEASQQQQAFNSANSTVNYKEQGEQLRQEIVRRAGQLQQVVASSMEMLKTNSDLIVRRLLEQLNGRLDQAKSKADKIINEPATNEVAIRALHTINQGLNNLNNMITNIVNRLDANNKVGAQRAGLAPTESNDGNRFKLNLHQLGQQFSSAISAIQSQQRQNAPLAPIQQQQQTQMGR